MTPARRGAHDLDQVRDVTDAERREAFHRIQRAAKKFGVEMTATRWQELGKP